MHEILYEGRPVFHKVHGLGIVSMRSFENEDWAHVNFKGNVESIYKKDLIDSDKLVAIISAEEKKEEAKVTFTEMFGYDIKTDKYNAGLVDYPNYLVNTGVISSGFESKQCAEDWYFFLKASGVESVVVELINYDWNINHLGIKKHTIAKIIEKSNGGIQ